MDFNCSVTLLKHWYIVCLKRNFSEINLYKKGACNYDASNMNIDRQTKSTDVYLPNVTLKFTDLSIYRVN